MELLSKCFIRERFTKEVLKLANDRGIKFAVEHPGILQPSSRVVAVHLLFESFRFCQRGGFFFGSLCNLHLAKACRGHHYGQGDATWDSTVCGSFAWPTASVHLFAMDVSRWLFLCAEAGACNVFGQGLQDRDHDPPGVAMTNKCSSQTWFPCNFAA